MRHLNKFNIDTGIIFRRLQDDWKKYDREFLKNNVEEALCNTLYQKKIVTQVYMESGESYLHRFSKYQSELDIAKMPGNFPFPNYFLLPQREPFIYHFILCDESCILGIKDNYFDLFFALYFSLTDIIKESESFLKYHLKRTFKNDNEWFKNYLNNICLKYKEFLHNKYVPFVQRFFETLVLQEKGDEEIKIENNKEFTTARQVLAITYLLEEVGINRGNTSLTEIARFIQFLTGKETGAGKINDTTIYKRVKSPFSKTDKKLEIDLQYIRLYIEKLGIQNIVNRINKEIGSKE